MCLFFKGSWVVVGIRCFIIGILFYKVSVDNVIVKFFLRKNWCVKIEKCMGDKLLMSVCIFKYNVEFLSLCCIKYLR